MYYNSFQILVFCLNWEFPKCVSNWCHNDRFYHVFLFLEAVLLILWEFCTLYLDHIPNSSHIHLLYITHLILSFLLFFLPYQVHLVLCNYPWVLGLTWLVIHLLAVTPLKRTDSLSHQLSKAKSSPDRAGVWLERCSCCQNRCEFICATGMIFVSGFMSA